MAEHYGARFFGEREAAVYDEQVAGMFVPAVVAPAVDLLAGLHLPKLRRSRSIARVMSWSNSSR